MNITLDSLTLANGRILIEKIDGGIYKVCKVAKNCGKACNYEGLGRNIQEGDIILLYYYIYSTVSIEGKIYYIIKPSEIYGIFD